MDSTVSPLKSWLIKVLNGPHSGAQLLLSQDVTIGSSLECDLILNDPHIRALHCQIKKEEADALTVILKEGIVFINGKKIEQGSGILKMGDVLTIGSTHLTAGPNDQIWPAITLPQIEEVGGVYQPIVPKAPTVQDELDKNSLTIVKTVKKKSLVSSTSLIVLGSIGSLIIAAVALFGIVFYKNMFLPRDEFTPSSFEKGLAPSSKRERAVAEAAVVKLHKKIPKGTIKVIERNGTVQLYIYASNQADYDEVRKVMNKQIVPVPYGIVNTMDLQESARTMIKSLNLALSVTVDSEGKATWGGYLPNRALLDNMKETVERDISPIAENDYHIFFGDEVVKTIRSVFIQNQLEPLTVVPERTDITLLGTIAFSEQGRLQKVIEELGHQFQEKVPFVNKVILGVVAQKAHSFFNSPVVSISVSNFPYAVLQSGEHIFIGAKVNDGYEVDSITAEGIGLKGKSGEKLIPIGGRLLP